MSYCLDVMLVYPESLKKRQECRLKAYSFVSLHSGAIEAAILKIYGPEGSGKVVVQGNFVICRFQRGEIKNG